MSIIEKAVDKLGAQEQRRVSPEPSLAEKTASVTENPPVGATPPPAEDMASALREPLPQPPPVRRPTASSGESFETKASIELDLDKLARRGIVTPDTNASLLAEQFRIIKRPVLMQSALIGKDRPGLANVTMVASALPGEGKTATSLSLAMSIAMERDRRVLLIDADSLKCDTSKQLGCPSMLGLTDYLADPALTLADVMVSTNVDTLFVVPAGKRHSHVTELLASRRMRELLEFLSRGYPDLIIVLDSPPLLSVAGAKVLTTLVGQVVMVVEAIRTPQSAVTEALDIIGDGPQVGFVLNKSRYRSRIGYGYDYGYGYGYGYGDGQAGKA